MSTTAPYRDPQATSAWSLALDEPARGGWLGLAGAGVLAILVIRLAPPVALGLLLVVVVLASARWIIGGRRRELVLEGDALELHVVSPLGRRRVAELVSDGGVLVELQRAALEERGRPVELRLVSGSGALLVTLRDRERAAELELALSEALSARGLLALGGALQGGIRARRVDNQLLLAWDMRRSALSNEELGALAAAASWTAVMLGAVPLALPVAGPLALLPLLVLAALGPLSALPFARRRLRSRLEIWPGHFRFEQRRLLSRSVRSGAAGRLTARLIDGGHGKRLELRHGSERHGAIGHGLSEAELGWLSARIELGTAR